MQKHILFIQGGGVDGFEADAPLVASLQSELGANYQVHYPPMPSDENSPDFGWLAQIGREMDLINNEVILVGHSLGASMLLKYLTENEISQQIAGIFLVATPFWSGDESWVQGLKLKAGFEQHLPQTTPVFFYHCRDDDEVPFVHISHYKQKLPNAMIREIAIGGHQFNNDLRIVAQDILAL